MRKVVLFPLLVLALSGCAAVPSAQQSTSPSALPTPTHSPAATKPALADLVIGPEGLGPIVLGAPVPDQPADIAIVKYDPEYCKSSIEQSGGTFTSGAPFSGAWVANYDDPLAFTVLPAAGVRTGAVGTVAVNAWAPGSRSLIHTAEGIHPGDSVAELLKAYPTFTSVQHFTLSDIYTISGTAGRLVFEVSPAQASDYWATADLNRVLSIRAVAFGADNSPDAGPEMGTDGWGPCPT